MRAVDTNVIVRLAIRDDAEQVAVAEAYIAGGAWVSLLALAEMAWVLQVTYQRSPSAIAGTVDMLLQLEQLTLQDADAVAAALEHYRRKPALGFTDCLILEIGRKAGHIPLGTFDRDLAKLAGAQRL